MKRIIPSNIASYIWDGCLANVPTFGNITPHGKSVVLPYSSPLIKFAILPKNNPIGVTHEIMSR